jgi:hypothetical protein
VGTGRLAIKVQVSADADRERTPMLLQRQSWPAMKDAIRGWLKGATRGRR